jgi:hypothetical protein
MHQQQFYKIIVYFQTAVHASIQHPHHSIYNLLLKVEVGGDIITAVEEALAHMTVI